jgi:serine/threonine protein phosphatase PrpC
MSIFNKQTPILADMSKTSTPEIHTFAAAYYSKRHLDAAQYFRPGVSLESPATLAKLNVPGMETVAAGHDYMSMVRNVRGDERQLLLGVADGHGDKERGHYHSYVATRLLANLLIGFWPIYQLHLKNSLGGDMTSTRKITQLTEYCYEETQRMMTSPDFPSIDRYSGTTMSMALVIVVGDQRHLISTNAGDSQIIWSDDDTPYQECTMDHNCDNIQAVQGYATRLAAMRRPLQTHLDALDVKDMTTNMTRAELEEQIRTLLPRNVYYNRINCGQVTWNQPEFLDSWGRPQPITVFKYLGPEQDQVVLHQENYEKMSNYYPTGTQSKRLPDTYVREDGRTVAVPGKEADNWGSTLLGGPQTLHGLGDQQHLSHHSCLPHVSVTPINKKGRLLLATDGLTDLFYFADLMKWFADHETDPDLVDNFYQHLWTTANGDPAYPTAVLEGVTYPRWDDVGGMLVRFPDMKLDNRSLSNIGLHLLKTAQGE